LNVLYLRNGQKLTKGNVDGEVAFNQGKQDLSLFSGGDLKCLIKVDRCKYRRISLHTAVMIDLIQ
jgi:hypothetical protein